jgi:hypothetical protein
VTDDLLKALIAGLKIRTKNIKRGLLYVQKDLSEMRRYVDQLEGTGPDRRKSDRRNGEEGDD